MTLEWPILGELKYDKKQILKTVKAMCDALKKIDNASVGIFGNGPDEDAAKDLVEAEGCSAKISFEGAISANQIKTSLNHIMCWYSYLIMKEHQEHFWMGWRWV